jgi:hypothetical protein
VRSVNWTPFSPEKVRRPRSHPNRSPPRMGPTRQRNPGTTRERPGAPTRDEGRWNLAAKSREKLHRNVPLNVASGKTTRSCLPLSRVRSVASPNVHESTNLSSAVTCRLNRTRSRSGRSRTRRVPLTARRRRRHPPRRRRRCHPLSGPGRQGSPYPGGAGVDRRHPGLSR